MKKVISFILAFVLLFSAGTFVQTDALAASKMYAEDKLLEIEKTSGFVSGSTAAVVGNCYLFVAKVCEKLYGVTYDGEGLYGNYRSHHYSGNYYTVSTFTTSSRTPTSTDVENIISFFVNNATPGDIIHFGSYDQSYNKTHTVMIQSISTEKMSIYHSNYNVAQHSSSDCHVDDIYWDSFRKNPTQTIKNNDGTLYSFNSIFYNTMKVGGIGITINRYKNYEDKYYVVHASVPEVSVSRTSTTTMDVKWKELKGAEKYKIQYKKSGDKSYKTLSDNCKKTKYSVKDLEVGTKYYFRVSACFGTKFMDYSKAVSKTALPPTLSRLEFSPASSGLTLKWNPMSDLTGVKIYKSESKNGTYSKIKTITNNSTSTYLDQKIKYGKTYYYKIERYVKISGEEYSTTSSAISGKYTLSTPDISFKNKNATSVVITFKANGKNDTFHYYITDSDSKKFLTLTKTKDKTITVENLKSGETYSISCRQTTSVGNGEYTTMTFAATPKKAEITSVTLNPKGIKVAYSTDDDVDGYMIYRSTAQFGKYSLIKTVESKDTDSYIDTDIEYNKAYYYKVKSFVRHGSDEIVSEISDASTRVRMLLAKPKSVKVLRTTPTSMTIKWKALEDASKYIVEYKREDGEWKALKTTKSNKKIIEKLKVGKKYYFRVKAGNSIGWGNFSKEASNTALPPTPPKPTLKNMDNGIRVYWKTMTGVTGYKIYRATSKNGSYTAVKTITNPKATCFTDKNVQKNKVYYYKVARYVKKGETQYIGNKSKSSHLKYTK